ncbi:hypothetical protein HRED_02850, partial [Candidatus Haloredivivus sp. G17]
ILYRGRRYYTQVKQGDETNIKFGDDKFLIKSENYSENKERRKEVAKELKRWYRNKAKDKLVRRTYDLAEEVDEAPSSVEIIDYENKWGENQNGDIRLHWRLIMAPQEIQDYVIAHELCHLEVNDHSDLFWNHLSSIIPNHQEKREWLRKNAGQLTI